MRIAFAYFLMGLIVLGMAGCQQFACSQLTDQETSSDSSNSMGSDNALAHGEALSFEVLQSDSSTDCYGARFPLADITVTLLLKNEAASTLRLDRRAVGYCELAVVLDARGQIVPRAGLEPLLSFDPDVDTLELQSGEVFSVLVHVLDLAVDGFADPPYFLHVRFGGALWDTPARFFREVVNGPTIRLVEPTSE
jgi:hypothetical protein